ncbi:MAG: 50S ribosomal protein L25 [Thermodesulfobacteriota bacterium]
MSQLTLAARIRKEKGKGAARKLRKNEKIPVIFYGPKTEPTPLAVDYPELMRVIKESGSENAIFNLQFQSDQGTETRKAMIKELMTDPVKNTCLHADFYEISMDTEITVNVAIRLMNTPVGVTNGGVLEHIRRELQVSCLPDKLVEALEIDVSALDMGDAVHVEDIRLPEGIRTEEDGHLTVAVVSAPAAEEVEEAEEILEAEGEAEEAEAETAAAEETGAEKSEK